MAHLRLEEIGVALALLTRLPLPRVPDAAFARQGESAWAWPLAGLIVGGLAALAGLVAMEIGLPASMTAMLVLAVQILLTGAMHEDGLADSADGLWGGWTRARRLEIMKDSRIGTYGVLALVLSVGLRWSVLSVLLTLGGWPVVAVAVLSRAFLPAMMAILPNVRRDGLSDRVGAPPGAAVLAAIALSAALAVAAVGWPAVTAIPVIAVGVAGLGAIAMRKIGGQTGDILGAAQQVGEVLAGLSLVVLLV